MAIKPFPTLNGPSRTVGGDHGKVMFILNTNNSGADSYRRLWREDPNRIPRMIIPAVSGYLQLLSSCIADGNSMGNFSYMGALAPGDGFVITGHESRVTNSKNIIIRGMTSRHGGFLSGTLVQGNSLGIASTASGTPEDIIIDRCTLSWGSDQTSGFYAIRGTIQYCLIYEGLHSTGHSNGGNHGYGTLWGGSEVNFHHNLLAFFDQRNPMLQDTRLLANPLMDVRNNLVFAWNFRNANAEERCRVNFMHNKYIGKPGATSTILYTYKTLTSTGHSVYPFGNKISTLPSLAADVESQKAAITGFNPTQTAWKNTIVRNTPHTLSWDYDFDETADESEQLIYNYAGSPKRHIIDTRVINEAKGIHGILSKGSITDITGLIDRVDDSRHTPANEDDRGYPTLASAPVILTGSEYHKLPSWFIDKYDLDPMFPDYLEAGTPSERPENFIIFKGGGQGVQLSQYVGSVDYDNDLIYRLYRVLEFHYMPIPGGYEIDLLEPSVPSSHILTVVPTTGGTTNISGGNFTPSFSVLLAATPSSGYVFTRWEQLVGGTWTPIAGAGSTFNFLMPSVNTSVRAIFSQVFTLSVTSIGNGSVNNPDGPFISGQSISLVASPNTGYRYDKWERLIDSVWTDLSVTSAFNFIMLSENTQLRASFVLDSIPIPPITGQRFIARISEPIV